jgi:hypothetical protein
MEKRVSKPTTRDETIVSSLHKERLIGVNRLVLAQNPDSLMTTLKLRYREDHAALCTSTDCAFLRVRLHVLSPIHCHLRYGMLDCNKDRHAHARQPFAVGGNIESRSWLCTELREL